MVPLNKCYNRLTTFFESVVRMEIKQLEYFVTAHNCGSLSKAAAKLFTTQPNVSRVIKLFERTSKGLKLTAYGKSIYSYAENILKK